MHANSKRVALEIEKKVWYLITDFTKLTRSNKNGCDCRWSWSQYLAADIVSISGREIGPFSNNFGPDGRNLRKKNWKWIKLRNTLDSYIKSPIQIKSIFSIWIISILFSTINKYSADFFCHLQFYVSFYFQQFEQTNCIRFEKESFWKLISGEFLFIGKKNDLRTYILLLSNKEKSHFNIYCNYTFNHLWTS